MKKKNPTPLEIAKAASDVFNIDIFDNQRGHFHVYARALVCWIMRDKLQMRWTYIAEWFQENGKHMNHSTAMHLVKMYPSYRQKNIKIRKLEKRFYFTENVNFDEIDKIEYLEKKYFKLESDYLELNKKLKNPLVNLVLDVPTNKSSEMKNRIKMIKSAWS